MLLAASSRILVCLAAPLALTPAIAQADHPMGVFGPGVGGPVVTPTADTLASGSWSVSLHNEYRRFDAPSRAKLEAQAAEAGHVHSLRYLWSPSLGIAYGLADRLTLAARLPYVERSELEEGHVHGGGASVHALGDSAGLGDASFGAHWRAWEDDGGRALAVSVGTFAPTGKTDVRDAEGARFATEHQPGSGAWRPFLGTAYSHRVDRLGMHAGLRYTWATEGAQKTDLGDRGDYNLALTYRLKNAASAEHHHHGDAARPHHHHDEGASTLQWDLLLELNGEYQRPQRIAGVTEGESEHIVFLAPGLRVSGAGGWTAALSVGVPVHQDIGPEHIETDWRAVASVGYAF